LILSGALVLAVFGGERRAQTTGGALVGLGFGFMLLALTSSRLTDQPQAWAFAPGVASVAVGFGVLVLSPSDHVLGVAGWVWPGLLLILVGCCNEVASPVLEVPR